LLSGRTVIAGFQQHSAQTRQLVGKQELEQKEFEQKELDKEKNGGSVTF
jgi:hypothetical protein